MIELTAFVDVESTGLWRKDLDDYDDSQPHIIQLAAKVVDSKRRRVGWFSRIVRPVGFSIEAGAQQVHGISEEYAHQVGVDLIIALAELKATVQGASRIVGHNIQKFDYPLIARDIAHAGSEGLWWRAKASKLYDTMEASKPILKLPGKYDDFKWPSLEEAMRFFGKADWKSTHDAMDDVEATEEIYWRLQDHASQPPAPSNGIPPKPRAEASSGA